MKLPPADSALGRLMATLPRDGRIQWIGVRPGRDEPVVELDEVQVETGTGLVGDRYAGGSGKRGVTLIQAEHLPVIATLAGLDAIHPTTLRRNLVVSGIPVIALKGRRFRIGDVVLEGTSPCDPCSKMEQALGPGGYNAMRGHGGLCARVIEGGVIRRGDAVVALQD
ncbi:MOSC domain-containing protein [Lysobacter korlensis]|uniref:MOSC domain-containing protein n=1 Tax=Lysobacter korlensis TaxID=553636 RepID=A0ABV6RND5_9GAMM